MIPTLAVILALCFATLVGALARGGGAALFTTPRHPDPGAPPDGPDGTPSPLRAVAYAAADGSLLAAWAADPASPARPTVLILAGPGQGKAGLLAPALALAQGGYGVFLTARRPASLIPKAGWGEAALLADARAALDHLTARGLSGSRLVILGVSAAAALALHMAWERRPAAVVLAAPPTSGADLLAARWHLPLLSGLAAHPLKVVERLRAAAPACSLLVLHGLADGVVPPAMGWAVFTAAPEPKRAAWIKGADHLTLWEKGGTEALLDFLAGRRGPATTLDQEAPWRAPGLPVPRKP
ncbi:alpha/beta hydrolase [Azospirillum sp. B4]|uniref:alpha/beta hydrolase n=1 Tax=Azospirillum sp. B4 TaxID=95605 RepID=UPI000346F113|nr:alpha/beta hydrolase [Azospirillum sp. B4]